MKKYIFFLCVVISVVYIHSCINKTNFDRFSEAVIDGTAKFTAQVDGENKSFVIKKAEALGDTLLKVTLEDALNQEIHLEFFDEKYHRHGTWEWYPGWYYTSRNSYFYHFLTVEKENGERYTIHAEY